MGQGFIRQQQQRLLAQQAGQGQALALAAGEGGHGLLQQVSAEIDPGEDAALAAVSRGSSRLSRARGQPQRASRAAFRFCCTRQLLDQAQVLPEGADAGPAAAGAGAWSAPGRPRARAPRRRSGLSRPLATPAGCSCPRRWGPPGPPARPAAAATTHRPGEGRCGPARSTARSSSRGRSGELIKAGDSGRMRTGTTEPPDILGLRRAAP